MKLGTMLQDVVPSLVQRPSTERYPTERHPVPARLRGLLTWDRASCTGCGMCVTDCPSQALDLVAYDKKARRIVLTLHADRCTFCGQCVFTCKQGSLALSSESWELATLGRETLGLWFGDPEDVHLAREGVLPGVPAGGNDGGS